jgi:methyltransferase of ATP-grasp peptide maturase system
MTERAAILRSRLVERLVAAGLLCSSPWRQAFAEVPRHRFLPRFFRQTADLIGWEALANSDPDFLALVYSDATWVTQLDNDDSRWDAARREGMIAGTPTSSSTAPGLMALMLEALDVRSDHRVLEVGTATGYNTALLSHRLGSAQVTSIEYDHDIAARAGTALGIEGHRPTLVTGDGGLGHPPNTPYDRIVATCSFPFVPAAWLAQSRPGAMILTNLHRSLGGGALLLLTVAADGNASGAFLPDFGSFMVTRAHSTPDAQALLDRALRGPSGERRQTTVDVGMLDHPDFGMLASLLVSDAAPIGFDPGTGHQHWLLTGSGSWACLDTATRTVEQYGPDRLWDELEAAHQQWQQLGKPTRDRFGVTVDPDGRHTLWLDGPHHPLAGCTAHSTQTEPTPPPREGT